MSIPIGEIAVVVPARNEARLLPRAILALEETMARLSQTAPQLRTTLTVVLDSTTDNSTQILAAHPQVHVVSVDFGCVGAVRNAGIAAAVATSGVEPARLWVANTDADSAVPPHWLARHHAFATTGADLLLGTVEPIPGELSETRLARWRASHQLGEGHPHVHGANLGIRAEVFKRLGGFPDVEVGEDRALVSRARASGYQVIATDTCRVDTSARLQSRVEGGFANFLTTLGMPEECAGPSTASSLRT